MRQIFMSMEEIDTPADLADGEVVEVIRLGGPRDGDVIGYFTAKFDGWNRLDLEPVQAAKAAEGGTR